MSEYFFVEGSVNCDKEEGCGKPIMATDEEGSPIIFDVHCPEHGEHQMVLHEKCMSPEFAEAYKRLQSIAKAPFN